MPRVVCTPNTPFLGSQRFREASPNPLSKGNVSLTQPGSTWKSQAHREGGNHGHTARVSPLRQLPGLPVSVIHRSPLGCRHESLGVSVCNRSSHFWTLPRKQPLGEGLLTGRGPPALHSILYRLVRLIPETKCTPIS